MSKIGLNAKLYRNTATYEAPTWSEVTIISDLSINQTWEEGDASARESRVKQVVKTMLDLSFTGRMKKKPTDANYEAIMNAALSDDVLDLLIMDGDTETEGNRGWRVDAQIFSTNEDQSMSNVLFEDITIKPSITEHVVKAVRVNDAAALTYSEPGEDGGTFS